MKPVVSIVIPVYNGERALEACLRSVLPLNYPADRREILVVDNGSTDGTRDTIGRFASGVRLLRETSKGVACARNRGALEARGEIIAFTDADCIVDKDWLRELIAPLLSPDRDPSVAAVGGKNLAIPNGNYVEKFGEQIHNHQRAIEHCNPPYLITMNCAVRRDALEKIGRFDESFLRSEDVDMSFRLLQAGYAFRYQSSAIVYHRNEATLFGLLRQGCVHGFRATPVLKRHEKFLRTYGWRRMNSSGYRTIARALSDVCLGRDTAQAGCRLHFNAGKKLGKLAGSARYLYLNL